MTSAGVPVSPGKLSGGVVAYSPGFSLGTALLDKEGEGTVKLTPPRSIRGILRDDKGGTVANATVRVSYIFQTFGSRPNQQHLFFDPPLQLLPQLTTRTDDKGVWKIMGVPPQTTVHVRLDDDNYVDDSEQFNADGESNDPSRRGLVARRAGTISGLVLNQKGSPAVGIQVSASSAPTPSNGRRTESFGETKADGTFRLTRVPPGTYTLLTRPRKTMESLPVEGKEKVTPPALYIAPALENVRVEAARTAANNTLRLVAPAIVKGRVFDRKSGKPLSQVAVGAYGKSSPRTSGILPATFTDRQGRFELPLVPGANAIYAFESDYWDSDVPAEISSSARTLSAGANEIVELRIVRRFADVEGDIVEENGTPAPNVNITLWNTRGTGKSIHSDANGHFFLERMNVGTIRLDPHQEWTVVSSKSIVLPASPLRIVVHHNHMAKVTGRVADANGKPIEGVKMRFTMPITTAEGDNARSVMDMVSDARGEYAFDALKMPEALQLKLENASKKGYQWRDGGGAPVGAKSEDDAFALSDVVVSSLGGTLKGTVMDADGKTVQGVLLRSSGDGYQNLATSDAAGHFELADQPQNDVELLAALGRSFARVTVKGNEANARITLSPSAQLPARSVERAVALFKEMAPSADERTLDQAVEVLAPLQPTTALELLLSAPKAQEDKTRLSVLSYLSSNPSEEALTWARQELSRIQDDADFVQAGAKVGLLLSVRHPEDAKAVFDAINQRRSKITGNKAMLSIAYTAALAARLQLPAARDLFDESLALGLRNPTQLSSLVKPLAMGTTPLVEEILDELPPGEDNIHLYQEAIHEVATYDVAGARRLLDRMRELVDAIPQLPDVNGQYQGRNSYEFNWAFAAKDVLRALERNEAGAAKEIAEKVQLWHRPSALAWASEFGTREQRLAMVEQAVQAENRGPWMEAITLPRLGALAAELDETTATNLFLQSGQQIDVQRRDGSDSYSSDWSFYTAFWNPAQGRLSLEADWARLQQKAQKMTEDPYHMVAWSQASLAMAMSAIDLDRSLEWARQLSDKQVPYNPSPRARVLEFIGELLLQEPAKRRLLVISPQSGFDS